MPSKSLSSTDAGKDFSPLDSKIRYERILVPHDGSEMSDKALKHAVYLSKISGTEIVILHVLERKSREKGRKSVTTKEEGHKTTVREENKTLQESRNKCEQAGQLIKLLVWLEKDIMIL